MAALPLFLLLIREPRNQMILFLLSLVLTLFSIQGEIFSPLYFFAFIAISMGMILFLRYKAIYLFPVLIIGGASVLLIQFLKTKGYFEFARQSTAGDYVVIFTEFMVMLIYLFNGYSKSRRKEIQFRERYSVIGQEANSFAHNIKSMLATQYILNDNLKNSVGVRKRLDETIEDQKKSLIEMKEYLNSFNIFENTDIEKVDIASSIEKVKELLRIEDKNLVFTEKSQGNVIVVKQDFETILINILSNSKKAMTNKQQIYVAIKKNKLEVSSPFIENYETESGIGFKISQNLALKNNMQLEEKIEGDKFIYCLSF
tara:strand:- start:141 stop:1082 length:942 start_codon:yes stop_codon:yes gene_type:complete